MSEEIEPSPGMTRAGGRRDLIERLVERIGSSAHVQAAFGDPVERDGAVVIPVARVRCGFGGGQGGDEKAGGAGAGGGIQVTPVGYVEMKGGGVSYRPIRDMGAIAPLIVASGVAGLLILTGVSKLIPSREKGRG